MTHPYQPGDRVIYRFDRHSVPQPGTVSRSTDPYQVWINFDSPPEHKYTSSFTRLSFENVNRYDLEPIE